MPVSSQTVGGVNVWAFQGVVTDAEIKTAWAGLIVDGEYVINRSIYLAQFVDLTGVQGGYSVRLTIGVNNFLLHTLRDRSKSVFKQWHFRQTVGMVVVDRTKMVANWNGTALSYPLTSGGVYDGLSMEGGVFEYAVVGNTGLGGDSRFLNEMAFLSLNGTQVLSTAFTEQELQPQVRGFTELKGLTFTRNFGFPQTSFETSRIVVFRSNQNTQHPTQRPIRINNSASICYIDSEVRRNALPVTTNLIDGFGSQTARLLVLNNHTDESWFGETRLNFNGKVVNWGVNNQFFGGILKRFRFVGAGANGTVKVYDSRSTTEPQRSKFVSFNAKDFLDTEITTQTDANGRVEIVSMGAQMLPNLTITRFTDQRFTYQQFGKRVTVTDLDVTEGGDNDLSAFAPVVLVEQEGIVRSQVDINSATTIDSFQDLLEELHILAIGLSGEDSYSGAFNGNLFNFTGGILTTDFTEVVIDPLAASKISFNATTNTLTIKASILSDSEEVQRWNNITGTITLANDAEIEGIYQSSQGTSKIVEIVASTGSSIYVGNNNTGSTILYLEDVAAGTYRVYFEPNTNGAPILIARELYGFQRFTEVITLADGLNRFVPVDLEDVGIAETDLLVVQAYTELESPSKFYDSTAAFRLTEQGIKLGQIVTRSGRSLEISSFSHVIDKDAVEVYQINGSVITSKSTNYQSDDRYNTEILTAPFTLTATSDEIITIDIEDANGDSQISIDGGDGTFELYKVTTATATNDFANGTLIATVGNGIFRFIGEDGFDVIGIDINSNIRRRTSFSKGIYTQAFFVGDQIQLAQAPQVVENGVKLDILQLEINEIKGTGFVSSANSLKAIGVTVTDLGTPLQAADYVEADNASIAAIKAKTDTLVNTDLSAVALEASVQAVKAKTDILVNTDLSAVALEATSQEIKTAVNNIDGGGVTLAEIEASTILAKEATSQQIRTKVNTLNNTDLSAVALEATSQQIRTKVNTLNNTDLTLVAKESTSQAIKSKTDTLVNTDLTLVAKESTSQAIKSKTDSLVNTDLTLVAKESTVQAIKSKTDSLQNADLSLVALESSVQEVKDGIGNVTVDNEAIALEVWENQPERLKNVATVESTGDQIVSA